MRSEKTSGEPSSNWQPSNHSNLIRYVPSGTYYARFRVKGKLIWRSLKTDKVTVAQMRLADMEKAERAKAESGHIDNTKGKLLVQHAINAYRANGFRPAIPRSKKDVKPLKPAAVAYYEQRLDALLKDWPELPKMELRKITERDCKKWADKARTDDSSSVFNHTLGLLRNIFEFGIKAGARYDNPARAIMRESEVNEKPELPEADKFNEFIAEIENGGGGFSKACADLVRFLAFGGFRKGEAAFVTWGDCDFKRKQITVRGHPETGLKGRKPGEIRFVPMIPDMLTLLNRLKSEKPEAQPTDLVMSVRECQKAMDRAAEEVGMKRITHHDLRHMFATRAIEIGVDIPTVSGWLGHVDGGALAMKTYGHVRNQHSAEQASKVTFGGAR